MTIRRRLVGWYRFLQVSIILFGALAYSWPDFGYNHTFRMVSLALLLAAVLGLFAMGFRCPRCRKSFLPRATTVLMKQDACACLNCGIDIDAANPRGAGP